MQVEYKTFEEFAKQLYSRLGGIEDCLVDLAMGKTPIRKILRSPDAEEYLTVGEAATELKVSRPTIYKWMRAGQLKYYRIGSRIRFRRSEIFGFKPAKVSR